MLLDNSVPWIANNGLRVEGRTFNSISLTWSLVKENTEPSSSSGSASKTSTPRPLSTTSLSKSKSSAIINNLNESSCSIVQALEMEDDSLASGVDDLDNKPLLGGLEGPWYELQMKKGNNETWETIYRGYRERYEMKDLVPNTLEYFRMKRNGEEEWGSIINAATDSVPPYAEDLHRAILCNAEDMVIRIIESCKPIRLRKLLECHDTYGMTPLMIACHNGNIEIVKMLLEGGAQINDRTLTTKRTALMYACMQGDIYLLREVNSAGADWSLKDSTGCTAFHYAVNSDKISSMKFGIAKCGNQIIHERDMLGWTPLLRSLIVGNDSSVVELLLKEGADPNAMDFIHEKSCLIVTAMLGKNEECSLLLKFGADPKLKNANGKTAHEIAFSLKNMSIADKILAVLNKLATEEEAVESLQE